MADNRSYVYRRVRRELNLTPAQAAGVVGGLGGESGKTLDPNAVNPSSGALGIGQWLGGRARGVRKGDVRQQTSHLIAELKGPERAALSRIKGARNINDATSAFVRHFERPSAGEIASSMPARLGYARDAFKAFSGMDPGSGGGGGDGATTTTVPGAPEGNLDLGQSQSGLALVQALTQAQRAPRATAGVPAPAFSAQAVTPAGYQPVQSAGGGGPQQMDVGEMADLVKTIGGEVPATQLQQGPDQTITTGGGGGDAAGGTIKTGGYPLGKQGKVIGTPHAGTHTLGNWQSDNALDIRIPVGTPMVAAEGGTVVKVKHHPQDGGRFAGDQITIRSGDNSYFYAHGVAAKNLKPGQKVKAGQVIGRSGSANGVPHLHIGVERGDPRKIFG